MVELLRRPVSESPELRQISRPAESTVSFVASDGRQKLQINATTGGIRRRNDEGGGRRLLEVLRAVEDAILRDKRRADVPREQGVREVQCIVLGDIRQGPFEHRHQFTVGNGVYHAERF